MFCSFPPTYVLECRYSLNVCSIAKQSLTNNKFNLHELQSTPTHPSISVTSPNISSSFIAHPNLANQPNTPFVIDTIDAIAAVTTVDATLAILAATAVDAALAIRKVLGANATIAIEAVCGTNV
jgi:hypothetical protein